MKWMLLIFFSYSAFGKPTGPLVDRIKHMKWDGESYTLTLTNYYKPITISEKNPVVPCLENAVKSNMEILITVDSDIPMISSCKLYSGSAPMTKSTIQAQEEKNTKKIEKR